MVNILHDAKKVPISMTGYCLLQWDFNAKGFARHSAQLPESVVDQILEWRNIEKETAQRCAGIVKKCKYIYCDAIETIRKEFGLEVE